jgi:hypothetical protein
MATLTSYLLVSAPDDVSAVQEHPLVKDEALEVREVIRADSEQAASLTLAHQAPVEEQPDLSDTARGLSEAFPDASVLLCAVEERFDQIERVQATTYRAGKEAGKVEHGYIFNVGGG